MIVFKSYFTVMKRNAISILIYIVIFTIITLAIAFSQKKGDEMKVSNGFTIAVINNDGSQESLALVEYLNKHFKVKNFEDDEVLLKESLLSQYISYALKIDKGGKLTSYVYSNMAIQMVANEKVREFIGLHQLLGPYELEEKTEVVVGDILNNNLKISHNTKEEEANISYHFYGYFNILSFTLMSIIMIGIFIGRNAFAKTLIKNRIEISGESMKQIHLKLLIGACFFVGLVWFYFVALGIFAFGIRTLLEPATYYYVFASFLFLLPTSFLSYLIALFTKNIEMSSALTNIVTLPSAFVSGVFIPKAFLPAFAERLAIFSPMYWTNRIYQNIVDGVFISKETLYFIIVELFMAIMFLSIALVVGKNRALKAA